MLALKPLSFLKKIGGGRDFVSIKKQFGQLYPERRPILLVAPNECGIDKFICSTIRPSQMSFTEFFYWQGPANFLPGYLVYEPLEDPLYFPKYLVSPFTTLKVNNKVFFQAFFCKTFFFLNIFNFQNSIVMKNS